MQTDRGFGHFDIGSAYYLVESPTAPGIGETTGSGNNE
jgi:hypothetical protein